MAKERSKVVFLFVLLELSDPQSFLCRSDLDELLEECP